MEDKNRLRKTQGEEDILTILMLISAGSLSMIYDLDKLSPWGVIAGLICIIGALAFSSMITDPGIRVRWAGLCLYSTLEAGVIVANIAGSNLFWIKVSLVLLIEFLLAMILIIGWFEWGKTGKSELREYLLGQHEIFNKFCPNWLKNFLFDQAGLKHFGGGKRIRQV